MTSPRCSSFPFFSPLVLFGFLHCVEQRCQTPTGLLGKAKAMKQARSNKAGLLEIEHSLERITGDIQISMLTDIKIEIGQRPRPEGDTPKRKGSNPAGQTMLRLGRVRFNMLREGSVTLGEGTFGIVKSGQYMGGEVAIKKARGPVGDPDVLDSFR